MGITKPISIWEKNNTCRLVNTWFTGWWRTINCLEISTLQALKRWNVIGSKIYCHKWKYLLLIWNLTAAADRIKFIWIAGMNRNIQVLTILDVFSRWNVSHLIAYSIKYQDVIKLFERAFQHLTIPEKFYVRCDNGSQFIADMVQKYFIDKKVIQEFTKPATPEQNSHIESYHSIMEIGPPKRCCLPKVSIQRFKRC